MDWYGKVLVSLIAFIPLGGIDDENSTAIEIGYFLNTFN